MSIADLLPVRLEFFDRTARPTQKHRASDEVARLSGLLDGARLLIKGFTLQLEEQAAEHEAAIARIDERHGETVRGLEAEIERLRRQLEVGVLAEAAVTKTQEFPTIKQPVVRPVPLHEAREAGLLGPVTDPGLIH